MKPSRIFLSAFSTLLLGVSFTASAYAGKVLLTDNNLCHDKNSPYYKSIKKPKDKYASLADCLAAGGKLPKHAQKGQANKPPKMTVKRSNNDICHAPGSANYKSIKKPKNTYQSMAACLKAGGKTAKSTKGKKRPDEQVKLSAQGICHTKASPSYAKIKKPKNTYKSLNACIKAGGKKVKTAKSGKKQKP